MANVTFGGSARCPRCSQAGRHVGGATLKCLLRTPLTVIREVDYWFCATPSCPVVYFSSDGVQTFSETDVREVVFQKHADRPEAPICYCFGYSVGDLDEPERSRAVIGVIEAGVKAGQCACDWRNPQGSCCLGNVRVVARRAGLE